MKKYKFPFVVELVLAVKNLFRFACLNGEADCFDMLIDQALAVEKTKDADAFEEGLSLVKPSHRHITIRFFFREQICREYLFIQDPPAGVKDTPQTGAHSVEGERAIPPDGLIDDAGHAAFHLVQLSHAIDRIIEMAMTREALADVRGDLLALAQKSQDELLSKVDAYEKAFGPLPGEDGFVHKIESGKYVGVCIDKHKLKKELSFVLPMLKSLLNNRHKRILFPRPRRSKKRPRKDNDSST